MDNDEIFSRFLAITTPNGSAQPSVEAEPEEGSALHANLEITRYGLNMGTVASFLYFALAFSQMHLIPLNLGA